MGISYLGHRHYRNNPSVVMWSIGNEVLGMGTLK